MPKTAVVILNWNGRKFLEKFLPALLKHTDNAEIIVADNASEDDSHMFLQTHYPDLRYIQLDKNYGFAGGYNKALSQIEATYYVLLNSDIEVSDQWLSPLTKALDDTPELAACMPKIKAFARPDHFEYAGACGGFIDKYGFPFCRGRIMDTVEKDEGQYNERVNIMWATGACLAIRSNIFHQLGGFDEAFFAHMEEIDLCWRIHHLGKAIQVIPESVVYHVGGGTLPNESPFKLFLNFRNNLFLLYKNLPLHARKKIMLRRRVLDYIAYFIYLLKGQFHNAAAIRKAHRAYRKEKMNLERKHQSIKKAPESYFRRLIYPHSIVWHYMGKNKRKFSQLHFK
ncbi:MAG: glycosyltransferase family 2 protein [Bacteroidales bacterium]